MHCVRVCARCGHEVMIMLISGLGCVTVYRCNLITCVTSLSH